MNVLRTPDYPDITLHDVFYLERGYFFYNKKVYMLGAGYIVPVPAKVTTPLTLHLMAHFSNELIPDDPFEDKFGSEDDIKVRQSLLDN